MNMEQYCEVSLIGKEVLPRPGDLFDDVKQSFILREDGISIRSVDSPLRYEVSTFDKDWLVAQVQQFDPLKYKYIKNFTDENPKDAFFVTGTKIGEKMAVDIPSYNSEHTVTSVLHKCSLHMLIFCKQSITKETLRRCETYLCNSAQGKSHCFIPIEIVCKFESAYIYQALDKPGCRVTNAKYCFTEFCHILRASALSTIPLTAIVRIPRPLRVEAMNMSVANNRDNTSFQGKNSAIYKIKRNPSNHVSKEPKRQIPDVHSNKTLEQTEVGSQTQRGKGHGKTDVCKYENELSKSGAGRGFGTRLGRGIASGSKSQGPGKNTSSCKKSEDNVNPILAPMEDKSAPGSNRTRISNREFTENLDAHQYNPGLTANSCISSNSATVKDTPSTQMNIHQTVKNSEHTDSHGHVAGYERIVVEGNNAHEPQGTAETGSLGENQHLSKLNRGNAMSSGDLEQQRRRDTDVSQTLQNTNNKETALPGPGCLYRSNSESLSQKGKDTSIDSPLSRLSLERENKKAEELDPLTRREGITMGKESGFPNNQMTCNEKKKENKHDSEALSSNSSHGFQKGRISSGTDGSQSEQTRLHQVLNANDEDDEIDLKLTNQGASNLKQSKKQKAQKSDDMKSKLINPIKEENDGCGLGRKYYGTVNEKIPEKVIILLGASGSGKTTLINFIANYFLGKKSPDDELIYVETCSQTTSITAYTFCMNADDIPITIIDTPGLNDSSGNEIRDHVQTLKIFLANITTKSLDIHAIGFVAQAHLVRLTSSERLVMDYVSTLFGQNVSAHLMTFVTFADNQDTPPVIEAMNNYKVKFKLFLKFNNSSLSNDKLDQVDDLDRVYYRVCCRNWKKCLKTLKDMPALSVNAMKAVQSEVYNTTVTESAEKDLKAEIATFFSTYKREKILSKENLQVCEQIWSLGAVVQRLKSAQMFSSSTIEDILIEYAKETCKELRISPESIVHTLALAPSKALTVVGTEIIQTMSHTYVIMKDCESKSSSKNLIDIFRCHGCNNEKEHRMKRTEINWVKQAAIGLDIICFKCEDCKCAGNLHGEQPARPAPPPNKILRLTEVRLRKALQSYSLPGFTVPEEIFLNHLRENLAFENQDFVDAFIRTIKW